MIPNTKHRTLDSSGVTESSEFGISLQDSAHIMTILRDTLYSDKVLAVLREYSSNAWDAHREVGKGDVPIKVTLPSHMDPSLSIRDYGPGLSHEDVFQVYTQYGRSTKRDSDSAVGMLGIGSKSGFAYSDQFTITSYHMGKKRTYVAVLDKSEKGVINLLHEEPTDESGVEIQIAIRQEDIYEFTEKAQNLYKYFNPRPIINCDIPELPNAKLKLKHGIIFDNGGGEEGWVAVMGCVSYRINLEQLNGMPGAEYGVAPFLKNIAGALFFEIGDVHINASREELKYSTPTKNTLVEKFNLLTDEYVNASIAEIASTSLTPWEKRLKGQTLRYLGLPVPDSCSDLISGSISIGQVPVSFEIVQGDKHPTVIAIKEDSRILLRDDKRTLRGFNLGSYDYVVRPLDETPWDVVQKDLDTHLSSLGLTGIVIKKMSEMTWVSKVAASGRRVDARHRLRSFKFNPKAGYRSRSHSQYWDPEMRTPEKDDVFVILEYFEARGYNFYAEYKEDEALAKVFGGTIPEVYGYKSTEKKPIKPADCLGTEYNEWRKEWVKTLYTPAVKKQLDQWQWSSAISQYWNMDKSDENLEKLLKKELGATHPITVFVEKYRDGKAWLKKNSVNTSMLDNFSNRISLTLGKSEAETMMEGFLLKYPILNAVANGFVALWREHTEEIVNYIKLVDNS